MAISINLIKKVKRLMSGQCEKGNFSEWTYVMAFVPAAFTVAHLAVKRGVDHVPADGHRRPVPVGVSMASSMWDTILPPAGGASMTPATNRLLLTVRLTVATITSIPTLTIPLGQTGRYISPRPGLSLEAEQEQDRLTPVPGNATKRILRSPRRC
jgi:hypothetical protein